MIKLMKAKDERSLFTKYVEYLAKYLSKYIYLEKFTAQKLQKDLEKVGYKNKTCQQYVAEIIVIAFTFVALTLGIWILGLYIVSIGCGLVGLAFTVNKGYELPEKITEINSQIEFELPQFIRSFSQALEGEKDIIKILEKYRQICGQAFSYDLDVLITDLKTGNMEEALYKFDERLNIPIVTSFVSGLIGTAKGIDQKVFFYILERDIKMLSLKNLNKALEKRPNKIKIATTGIAISFIVILTYPLLINIITSLKFLE